MIKAEEFFICTCDNCGKAFGNDDYDYMVMPDKISMQNQLGDDDEWHTEKGDLDKHYCPDCFSFDDNNLLVIKKLSYEEKRRKILSKLLL